MTIGEIGSFGELIGAIATVGTLLYLAIQIRENTTWSKSQALEELIRRVTTWQARMNENPEMLSIYLQGKDHYEQFDVTERYRYNFIMLELCGLLETTFEHGKRGAIKPEAVASGRKWVLRELGGLGTRKWWKEMGRDRVSVDLAETIDEILQDSPPNKVAESDAVAPTV